MFFLSWVGFNEETKQPLVYVDSLLQFVCSRFLTTFWSTVRSPFIHMLFVGEFERKTKDSRLGMDILTRKPTICGKQLPKQDCGK